MLSFQNILYIHIFFGGLALSCFWIPLVAKKGQILHISAGILYLFSMLIVVSTALLLCTLILQDPLSSEHRKEFAWFLIFISILATTSAIYALRVWQFKQRLLSHHHPFDILNALLLIIVAVMTSYYGYRIQNSLFTYFPLIGFFLGVKQLYYWLSTPKFKMHAWFEHMAGMFTCVISTLTAFAVVGLPRVLSIDSQNWLLWLGPTLIFVPILLIWQNYYRKQFGLQ